MTAFPHAEQNQNLPNLQISWLMHPYLYLNAGVESFHFTVCSMVQNKFFHQLTKKLLTPFFSQFSRV